MSNLLHYYPADLALALRHHWPYQYVGDEVVLTWPLAAGCYRARCVQCFYLMQAKLGW